MVIMMFCEDFGDIKLGLFYMFNVWDIFLGDGEEILVVELKLF